jgi:hypothetical protein
MLRDSMDLAVQTNLEKLFAGVICSSFIVMVDDEPSGHIGELHTLLSHQFRPVIIVRSSGRPSTHFLEDLVASSEMFRVHSGELDPEALASPVAWARGKMRERIAKLNEINIWRRGGVL